MTRLAEIKPALSQLMSRGSGNLPPHLDTCSLALRHAPLPPGQYREVLLDAGADGRAFRAIINIASPVKELTINSVSDFTLSYEGTPGHGQGLGFAALAEAKTFKVIDPFLPVWNKRASLSSFARERLAGIEDYSRRYLLSAQMPADVVLAPWACSCCFETQYLDYLKSVFDLQGLGSLLIIRIPGRDLGQVPIQMADSPFLAWMAVAGFRPVWLLGFDNVRYDDDLSPFGPVAGRNSALFPLSENDLIRNFWDLINQLSAAALQAYCPMEDFSLAYMFSLYLVFQRMESINGSFLTKMYAEAVQWEREHAAERRSDNKTDIPKLLEEFSRSLPSLIERSGK